MCFDLPFYCTLVNQQVVDAVLVTEMMLLLLTHPTNDSVEIAVGLLKECGLYLMENETRGYNIIQETLRKILHEGQIDKRVQYMIEVFFVICRDRYKEYPVIPEGLDLVQDDEKITHAVELNHQIQTQDSLGKSPPGTFP